MKRRVVSCIAAALLFGGIATANAANKAETFTLTPFIGGITFDGDQHLETKPVYGIRGGYNFTENLGAEAVFDYVRTGGTRVDNDTDVYNYHLDLLYHFFPSNRAVPFLMAGIGGTDVSGKLIDQTRLGINYGIGVKYALTDSIDLRGEVRDVMYRYSEEMMHNVEYGIGLGFVFGGAKPAAAVVPAPTPAPAPAPAPVPVPGPKGSLSVTPSSVVKGSPATVAWQCHNADSAEIQPHVGPVALQGAKAVSAADSTDYTLTCSGPGGKSTSTSRLSVTEPPRPACTITATPDTIIEGQSSRLDWECINSDSADISPEIGKVAPKGSKTVAPSNTTSYTVTGSGAGASATGGSTITVNPLPPEKRAIALDVRFDTGKAVIKKQYHGEIGRVAAFLKEYPGVTGTIEGHTDNVGNHDMNVQLSQRRADAVLNYLVKQYGIDRSRLSAVGYGPDKPIADNKTPEGRLKNRRTVATFEATVPAKK